MVLFTVHCTTCSARLTVRNTSAIGQILECPKCGSMVEIAPPAGWQPPTPPKEASTAGPSARKSDAPTPKNESATAGTTANESAPPAKAIKRSPQLGVKETSTDPSAAGDSAEIAAMAEAGLDLESDAAKSIVQSEPPSNFAQSRNRQASGESNASDFDRDEGTSTLERRARKWTMIGGGMAAMLILAVTAWTLLSGDEPTPPPPAPRVDNPDLPAPPKPDVVTPKKPLAPLPGFSASWFPQQTQGVFSVKAAAWARQPAEARWLQQFDLFWRQCLEPLSQGLGLPISEVQRLTCASTNLREWSRQCVVIVELANPLDEASVDALLKDAQPIELKLRGAACHQLTSGPWLRPFVLINAQTIVTGPDDLLREIAQRDEAGLKNEGLSVLSQLIEATGSERDITLLFDMEALRRAEFDLPKAWFADWEQGRGSWQLVRSAPTALALAVDVTEQTACDVYLACEMESTAREVHAAMKQLLAAAGPALSNPNKSLASRVEAGEMTARDAETFEGLLGNAFAALNSRQSGVQGTVVWVRSSINSQTSQLAIAWISIVPVWEQVFALQSLVTAKIPIPPTESVDPKPKTTDRPEIDVASRLQLQLKGVDYRQRDLAGFVQVMSDLIAVPITLDLDALGEAGLGPDTKISVKQEETTVGAALHAALAAHGLEYVVQRGQLLVTTASRERGILRPETYDVSDLTAGDSDALLALEKLVRGFVAPGSWKSGGGPGTMKIADRRLTIQQSGSVHAQLRTFFEKLRLARGRAPQQLRNLTLDSRFTRARKGLLKQVTANFFQPTPLSQITTYVAQRSGVTILIDSLSLRQVGLSPNDKTTLKADKETLFDVLTKLTAALEIAFRVVDEKTLQIISRSEAASALELEFYPVGELLTRDLAADDLMLAADDLMQHLRTLFAAKTWSVSGGKGRLHFDKPARCLIVLQSQKLQIKVEDYLLNEKAKRKAKLDNEAR